MSASTGMKLGSHFKGLLSRLKESGRHHSANESVMAGLRSSEQEEAKHTALIYALEEGDRSGECHEEVDDIVQAAIAAYKAEHTQ